MLWLGNILGSSRAASSNEMSLDQPECATNYRTSSKIHNQSMPTTGRVLL